MKTWKTTIRAWALCSAVLLALSLAAPAFGQFQKSSSPPKNDSQFLFAFRDATAEATKSTVRVQCEGKDAALGTIVGEDGWILTKYSLLSNKVTVKLKDGKTVDAKIVGIHEEFDLAMLKVEMKGLTAVKFVPSKEAPVGNWLAIPGTGDDPIAVGVMSVATRNLGRDAFRDVRNPKRGFLGIQMEPTEGGIKITVVTRKSAADKAGVKVDDKVIAVNNEKIDSPEAMQKAMSKTKVGDVVTLKVVRGEEELELKATLEKVPADRSDVQNNMGSELSDRRSGFPTFFQTDAVLPPKDCGGPICDLDGHVLGVNIARAGRTESYAIPSEAITPILADLESGKLAPKPEPTKADLEREKKLTELKAAVKKAEEEKTAAEKKLKEAKDALDKAEKEGKEKK